MTAIIDLKANPQLLTSSPSGIACVFIPIDDKWGLKCYLDPNERNFAYKNQKRAAKRGLGPEVKNKIDIDIPEGTAVAFGNTGNGKKWIDETDNKLYCYVTEKVRLLANQKFINTPNETRKFRYMDLIQSRFTQKRLDLINQLAKVDFWFDDAHINNLGWKNHKLICIDFN